MMHIFDVRKSLSLLLVFAAVVSACGNKDDGGPKKESVTFIDDSIQAKVIPAEICNLPPRSSELVGTWIMEYEGKSTRITQNLFFEKEKLTFSVKCEMEGVVLNAQVQVGIQSTPAEFEILENQTLSDSKSVNGRQLNCTAELRKVKIKYEFQGSCLVLTNNDGSKKILAQAVPDKKGPQPPPEVEKPGAPPQQTPEPTPDTSANFACLSLNKENGIASLGMGATVELAMSAAIRRCQSSNKNCSSETKCSERTEKMYAWTCDGKFYPGLGSSRVEAQFNAQVNCIYNTGGENSNCPLPSDSVCYQD